MHPLDRERFEFWHKEVRRKDRLSMMEITGAIIVGAAILAFIWAIFVIGGA